ncbi:HNH endonuclease [Nocardioides sp. SYSU D00065]|uniref:HNH endonuclease n=1 Tax=Nocardioides sp. SYSU D00065 TaxID=2817378 RepID=UPI001B32D86F|nr:HNH endonuclease signature motif containing protein [Nocardioides sp. SYSU D00065]
MTAKNDTMERLALACRDLGYEVGDFLAEKLAEAQARAYLRAKPNGLLSDRQVAEFLRDILGRTPTAEEVDRTTRSGRARRITEAERIDLERKQNDRCATCGRFLDQASKPHVDHIEPLALGGADELGNLQLLCGDCNLGKGQLPCWQVGVPFLAKRLTTRLRYCVLARADGHCQVDGCDRGARVSELTPLLRVAAARGGAYRFDNLIAACAEHANSIHDRRTRESVTSLRRGGDSSRSRVAGVRSRRGR